MDSRVIVYANMKMRVFQGVESFLKTIYRFIELLYVLLRVFSLTAGSLRLQPLYNFALFKTKALQQSCVARADEIYHELKLCGQGGRILDIDCQLGYFSFYFAERGYLVEGMDERSKYVKVCKLLQRVNQKKARFSVKRFSPELIKEIRTDDYDIAFLLNTVKQLLIVKGAFFVQELIRDLLEKIPVLVIDLPMNDQSVMGEVANEAEIFSLCTGCSIKKVTCWPNHLSSNWHAVYLVKKNIQQFCSKPCLIYDRRMTAHRGAGYYGRSYYDCGASYLKKYLLEYNNPLKIFSEIECYQKIPSNPYFPQILSWQKNERSIEIMFSKLPGENIYNLLLQGKTLPIFPIVLDLIKGLKLLLDCGYYHNDVRLWNLLFDGSRTYLIDFGLIDQHENENTNIAILWVIEQLHRFYRHRYSYPLKEKPILEPGEFQPELRRVIQNLQTAENFKTFCLWFEQFLDSPNMDRTGDQDLLFPAS